MWRPTLVLYCIAPIVAEVLSGSTPPLTFIHPIPFLFLTGLYGSSALLIRETVRRRSLGWLNLLILGAAYGVLNEGLIATSWFNPYFPIPRSLASAHRFLGIDWPFVLWITPFHAIVSIAVPIVLVESLFISQHNQSWMSAKGLVSLGLWLTVLSLAGFRQFGFFSYRAKGYTHPPNTYYIALIVAVVLFWVGLKIRQPIMKSMVYAPLPNSWWMWVVSFLLTLVFMSLQWGSHRTFSVTIVVISCIIIAWIIAARWSSRDEWNIKHRFILCSGVMSYFLLVSGPALAVISPKTWEDNLIVSFCFVILLVYIYKTKLNHLSSAAAGKTTEP